MNRAAESATLPIRCESDEDFADLEPVEESNYELGSVLARGGMGQIIYARDRRTGRQVAIKQIADDLLDDLPGDARRALIARFQREARVTARLQHPSIVSVYEIGSFAGRPFLAMRLVQGEPLNTVIARCKSSAERLALLPKMIAVADALAYAHDQRVIHRDLKPANVIVGSFNDTVVIDWGLAKDLRATDRADSQPPWRPFAVNGLHTLAGSVFGTPHYMPPEQANGEIVDERADVYALGAILYHLLSGAPPYAGDDERTRSGSLLDEIRQRPPLALDAVDASVPRDLVSIVGKAMARDPKDRYVDAAELAADLRQFEAGQLVGVHDYSPAELARRWMRRHLAALVVGVSLMLVLIAVGSVALWSVHEARVRAEAAAERAQQRNDEAALLMERQGRTELAAGRFGIAAKALAKSYELGNHRDSLRLLLAQAMQSVRSIVLESYDEDSPSSIAVSADGKLMAKAGTDGIVKVWDLSDGRVVHELPVGEPVTAVGVSSDDSVIVAGTSSGRVVMWAADSGAVRGEHAVHLGPVAGVLFDGELAITVGVDGWMQLFRNAQPVGRFQHYSQEYASSGFSATAGMIGGDGVHQYVLSAWIEGSILHSISAEGVYLRRDISSGELVGDEFLGPVQIAVVDRARRYIALATLQALVVHDRSDGTVYRTDMPSSITTLDLTGEQPRIAVGMGDGQVAIVDLVSKKVIRLIKAHPADIASATLVHGDRWLVTSGGDGLARVWDVDTGIEVAAFGLGENPVQLCLPDRGGTRVVTASADGIRLWRLDDGSIPATIDIAHDLWSARLLPGDRKLLAIHDRGAEIWDLASHRRVVNVSMEEDAMVFASADGSLLLAGRQFHDAVRGRSLALLPPDLHPVSAAFRADGRSAIIGIDRGGAIVVDPTTGAQVGTIDQGRAMTMFTSFLPDGTILIACADRTLSIWTDTGQQIARLIQHEDGIRFMDVTADGARAVTVDGAGFRLWDVAHRTVIGTGRGRIRRARFSADGTRLITSHYDKRAMVWDATTAERLLTLKGHGARVNDAFLDATGARAITIANDGFTRLWDANTGAPLWRRPSEATQGVGALSTATGRVVTKHGRRLYVWRLTGETRDAAEVSAEVEQTQLALGSSE